MVRIAEWAERAIQANVISSDELRKWEEDMGKYPIKVISEQMMIGASCSSYNPNEIPRHSSTHVWNNGAWSDMEDVYNSRSKVRCGYCGRKNDHERELCASCGATL